MKTNNNLILNENRTILVGGVEEATGARAVGSILAIAKIAGHAMAGLGAGRRVQRDDPSAIVVLATDIETVSGGTIEAFVAATRENDSNARHSRRADDDVVHLVSVGHSSFF